MVHRGDAPEDKDPKTAGPNRRRNGGQAHTAHGGQTNAGEDHGPGQGKLDRPEHLAAGEPQGQTCLHEAGRHTLQADHRGAQQRQQGVDAQGNNGRSWANAPQERHRKQNTKQGQRGDGLKPIGRGQGKPRQNGPTGSQHPQRDGEYQPDRHRQRHQGEVLGNPTGQIRGHRSRTPDWSLEPPGSTRSQLLWLAQ